MHACMHAASVRNVADNFLTLKFMDPTTHKRKTCRIKTTIDIYGLIGISVLVAFTVENVVLFPCLMFTVMFVSFMLNEVRN